MEDFLPIKSLGQTHQLERYKKWLVALPKASVSLPKASVS